MRRFIWRCRAANLNLTFSGCGSRRLKFINLSKGSRGEVFLRLDAADLKFCDGSYLVGSDRAKFQIQQSINQKAKFLARFRTNLSSWSNT